MLGKSAWKCRLISWNGLRLNCEVGTLAVIANSAEDRQRQRQRHHDIAGARAAGGQRRHRLVADAEVGVRHMAATCSWRGETSLILSRAS